MEEIPLRFNRLYQTGRIRGGNHLGVHHLVGREHRHLGILYSHISDRVQKVLKYILLLLQVGATLMPLSEQNSSL